MILKKKNLRQKLVKNKQVIGNLKNTSKYRTITDLSKRNQYRKQVVLSKYIKLVKDAEK